MTSKRKPKKIETDRGRELCNSIFQNSLKAITLNIIHEKAHLAVFVQNALTVVFEISLEDLFFEKR